MITIHATPTQEGDSYIFDRVRQISTCTAPARTVAVVAERADDGEVRAGRYRALATVSYLVDRYRSPADPDGPPPIADSPEGLAASGWGYMGSFATHDCVVLGGQDSPVSLNRQRLESDVVATRVINLAPPASDYFSALEHAASRLVEQANESLAGEDAE